VLKCIVLFLCACIVGSLRWRRIWPHLWPVCCSTKGTCLPVSLHGQHGQSEAVQCEFISHSGMGGAWVKKREKWREGKSLR